MSENVSNIEQQEPVLKDMAENTRSLRKLALFGYFGLLIWVIIWHFVLAENEQYSRLFLVLFWVVPLLFPMRGMIKGNPYTHAWANFIVMIYFLHGLTAIYTETKWWYAAIELVFASMMFVGCCYYARARGRELGLKLKKLSELK